MNRKFVLILAVLGILIVVGIMVTMVAIIKDVSLEDNHMAPTALMVPPASVTKAPTQITPTRATKLEAAPSATQTVRMEAPVPVAVEPTTTSQSNAVCGALQSRLLRKEKGRSTLSGDPLKVRLEPEGDKIGNLSNGEEFTITDGPICSNGKLWWSIRNTRISGWIMEGEGSTYFVEPIS